MEIKRVGIYCRVSTKDQNAETQLHDLRGYSGRSGWEIVTEQVDRGWSRTTDKRPGLDTILQMARQREFDTLLVWKQDRLATSLPHLVSLVNELSGIGVFLVSYKDGINTSIDTPYTRFYFKLMASFSDLEREMILERTAAGRQRLFDIFKETGQVKTKTGAWFGRPRLSVDDVIAEYAGRYAAGLVGLDEVATAAGCSKPTACRRLKAFHISPPKEGLLLVG